MSTNWFHNVLFGSNESKIKALEKAQNIDAKQFKEVFNALKEWQEAQKIDVEQFEKVFSALEEKIGTEQFQRMQEHLNGLQEKVETLTGTVADQGNQIVDLAETVAEQEKIMLTCCIVASVVALAAISFIGFCIYQGIKSEREKQKSLSDTPDAKLNDVSNTEGQRLMTMG